MIRAALITTLMLDGDVIVIGAGAAGLAAARHLAACGLRAIVLEAQDRVGGRVLEAAKGATETELGAEFIHGKAPETRALLREIGQCEAELGGSDWQLGADGELRCSDEDFRVSVALFNDVDKLETDESVEQFFARYDGDAKAAKHVQNARTFVEGFDAADPVKASARGIAFEWRSGVDSQTARPVGGYRPMISHLHKVSVDAGVRFELSSVVEQVTWERGSVSITTRGESGARTLRARAAIVTVPVAILRNERDGKILFSPPLPDEKHEALDKIETGDVVKVGLWFRTCFWEEIRNGRYRDAGFFRSFGTFQAFWTQLPLHKPVIIAWLGGPDATLVRQQPGGEIVMEALEQFGTLLGDPQRAGREFEGAIMHDWGGDPFACGAYSYLGVGGENARFELCSPIEDTLFFAGEATSEDGQGGTVNGALASGQRAAREVAQALTANRPR